MFSFSTGLSLYHVMCVGAGRKREKCNRHKISTADHAYREFLLSRAISTSVIAFQLIWVLCTSICHRRDPYLNWIISSTDKTGYQPSMSLNRARSVWIIIAYTAVNGVLLEIGCLVPPVSRVQSQSLVASINPYLALISEYFEQLFKYYT